MNPYMNIGLPPNSDKQTLSSALCIELGESSLQKLIKIKAFKSGLVCTSWWYAKYGSFLFLLQIRDVIMIT